MITFIKQTDEENLSREFRETTEAVAETEAEAEKRQWKAGGRTLEEMNVIMKQIDKENSVENLERLQRQWQRQRQSQWKVGGRSLEEMIIFIKQIDKEQFGREFRETTEAVAETEVAR